MTICACSVRLNPGDFKQENNSLPQLKNLQPLAIKAKLTGTKDKALPLAGTDVIINEDEFTKELVKRLKNSLEYNGITISQDVPRVIEIQTTYVSLQPDRTTYCVIDFNRKLSNDAIHGFQARSKSWNYETACDEALNQAVSLILNDPDTLKYLKGE
jgi:hypothetical protein